MNKHQRIAKQKALDFRDSHGFSSHEPIYLKSLLLKLRVLTVFKPLSDSFSGMAYKCGEEAKFILINSNQTLGRQHFTIGHELYHLFIQENFTYRVCHTGSFSKDDIEEYRADLFSINLILSEEAIYKIVPEEELEKKSVSLDTIVEIEQQYNCSRSALLYRLMNMGLIKNTDFNDYKKNVIVSAKKRGYRAELYVPTNIDEVIGDYGQIAKSLFEENKISESHYINLLSDIGIDVWEEEPDIEDGF